MSSASRHFDALTGLRGIAAWLVVLYHTRLALTEIMAPAVIAVFAKGYLAVDLFFMLSGFVIWYNYAERLASGDGSATRTFLWRRFTRVWPLHAVMLATYIAFVAVLQVTGRSTVGYPLRELPMHLLLVHNWGFTDQLAWNHPAWSISAEFAAYLLFPLIVLARPQRLKLGGLLLLALGLLLALHAKFALAGHTVVGAEIPRMGLWRCLMGFSLGVVLCLLWLQLRYRKYAAPFAVIACAAILTVGLGLRLPETLFAPAALFAGLLALALGKGLVVRLLSSRPLLHLGKISYSTYLGHYLLWTVWKIACVDDKIQVSWVSLTGFLGTVFAVSIVLYHWVEQPAQRWLNAHPPRWASATRAISAQ